MDEAAYRNTYLQVNQQRCVFEKIILLRYANCQQQQKIHLAEREAMACGDARAQQQCQALLNEMRHQARFALQLSEVNKPLPHAQEVKVQAGGLFGLQQVLAREDPRQTDSLADDHSRFDPRQEQPLTNIFHTLSLANSEFSGLADYPWQAIVAAIQNFAPARPARKKKRQKKTAD